MPYVVFLCFWSLWLVVGRKIIEYDFVSFVMRLSFGIERRCVI